MSHVRGTIYITERKRNEQGFRQVRNVASTVGWKNALVLLKELQKKRPDSVFKFDNKPVDIWDYES
tara:strand:- start:502 stop:699 length:198 start_codon:yes stop_codon:yes gene_type:complete